MITRKDIKLRYWVTSEKMRRRGKKDKKKNFAYTKSARKQHEKRMEWRWNDHSVAATKLISSLR